MFDSLSEEGTAKKAVPPKTFSRLTISTESGRARTVHTVHCHTYTAFLAAHVYICVTTPILPEYLC